MTITQMLGQSLILTGLGMGVVFSFLIIMICFVLLSGKIIKALKLDKDDKAPQSGAPVANSAAQTNAIVAAIAAAVHDKQIK